MKVEMGWENVKLGMQARPPWKRRSQPFPSGQRPTRQIRCRIHRQLRAECSLHFLILQTKNEPSPFGKETEKAHLCCTTPVKRRRTLAALCLILRQHTVSDAKLVDDVALLARRYAHFLEDVPHVDLQFLDAAIARIPSDRPNDGGI